MSTLHEPYYVPAQSHWPIIGAIGLGSLAIGIVNILHQEPVGHYFFLLGALIIVAMLWGWFRDVIHESQAGLYSAQMDRSFRWGMVWFIFSEVMFFGAFFGALFYAREISVPWLGGAGYKASTPLLWPAFVPEWPLLTNPDPIKFVGPTSTIHAWGLPAINTLLLLTSGATLTWAHWGLTQERRKQLCIGLFLTVILGISFLICQAYEYIHAYTELGLKLSSGIYGSTFFMLTGFHGAHVTLGTIMLITILGRSLRGDFSPKHHFAFEGVAWYWHFVDVVWLLLFVLVYWL
jgi:cytochrome c oxidase subunit 3